MILSPQNSLINMHNNQKSYGVVLKVHTIPLYYSSAKNYSNNIQNGMSAKGNIDKRTLWGLFSEFDEP